MASDDTIGSAGLSATRQHDRAAELKGAGGPEALERGARLGRYLVVDVLGRGGMGVVYAAYDPELDRKLAIKLVRAELDGGEEATARLLREAQAMARVVHPNVVTVHDVGTWEGRVFLAMELVEGTTLREWLALKRRTRAEILSIYQAAGAGLAAAHAAGLVHRDFKPDNVLVGADGRARVTDFGLVRPAAGPSAAPTEPAHPARPLTQSANNALTELGAVIGTPAYMAPEQLEGKVAGAAADQFAFAVSLYEALYGARPFETRDFSQLSQAVLAGAVRPAPAGSKVPGWLRRVLLRGLEVAPERRFPSMPALLSALKKDPAARLRRVAVALVVLLVAGSGPAFMEWRSYAEEHRCEATAHGLDDVWGEGRKAALAQTYASTPGVPADAWARVQRWGDVWTERWRKARVAACEASRTGRVDARDVAASTRCIETRRVEFRAVTDLLLTGDKAALSASDRVFNGSVGMVKACAVLPNQSPLLASATESDRIVELVTRSNARMIAQEVEPAQEDALEALKQARALGAQPMVARALAALAEVRFVRGDFDASVEGYRQAVLAAEASGEAELVVNFRAQLAYILAVERAQFDEALWELDQAAATGERVGLTPEVTGFLLRQRAIVLGQADRSKEALPMVERSLALARGYQETPLDLMAPTEAAADVQMNLGHPASASRLYEEHLEALKATSGPLAAHFLPNSYSGQSLITLGQERAGLERLERLREVLPDAGMPAEQRQLNDAWSALAWASLGDEAAAVRASTLARDAGIELTLDADRAELEMVLARTDLVRGRPSRALQGFQDAKHILETSESAHRRSLIEVATGHAECLRRLGRALDADKQLRPALAEGEKSSSEFDLSLAQARVELAALNPGRLDGGSPSQQTLQADLALEVRELGSENADLAPVLLALARLELQQDHREGALAVLERAVKVSERRPGDRYALAEARFALAQVLAGEAASLPRAKELASQALEALKSLPEPVPLTKEVQRWLAARR